MFNNSNCKTNTTLEVSSEFGLLLDHRLIQTAYMDIPMNALSLVNQEPSLPANNEAIIQMLGLGGYSDGGSSCNTGKLVDDIVRNLDLDAFTLLPNTEGAPAAPIGFESVLDHQQVLGSTLGAYQPTETVSYVDLSPPGVENSPYSVSGGSFFSNESYSLSAFPQEISSFVPATPPVGSQDSRKPAGGKTIRGRRRELKVKLYEREEPLSDPEEEKKRQNAINAKKNRDKHNLKLQELEDLVASLTAERDALQPTNTKLRNKCDAFERQLRTVCQQFNVPVIILPQE